MLERGRDKWAKRGDSLEAVDDGEYEGDNLAGE